MKKMWKWIGISVGGLAGLIILAAGGLILSSDLRFNRQYAVTPEAVAIPHDAASLARGQHWVAMHCQGCHGPDLGGGEFFTDPAIGLVDAPNLTAGQGGLGASYTDADWVRAIRHGVKGDGTSVFIMPSNDFYYLSDADLGSLIAYLKSVPPVNRETRPRSFTLFAKLLYGLGVFGNLLYAETIPAAPPPPAPPAGETAAYGEYLVNAHGCKSCHGAALSGAQPSEPGSPPAPNLTPGGALRSWSETDFVTAMRTGITPDGRRLSDFMPWQGLGQMTDEELRATWLFLQAQPALATVR